jgi:NDP-sugar pyrophosphorylase family protein
MSQFHFTESEAFTITDEPWKTVENLIDRIATLVNQLGDDYVITDGVAIHKTATIAHNVTIKPPAIISEQCFVGANSYLRGGVFLEPRAKVGISCEIKTSIILEDSAVAHFNFVGDSILGKNVNIEAGAILANHYNEREDKTVFVHINGKRISTNLQKLGSFVGDGCRIGANAVLSPGTILLPNTIVKRLELVEQDK